MALLPHHERFCRIGQAVEAGGQKTGKMAVGTRKLGKGRGWRGTGVSATPDWRELLGDVQGDMQPCAQENGAGLRPPAEAVSNPSRRYRQQAGARLPARLLFWCEFGGCVVP